MDTSFRAVLDTDGIHFKPQAKRHVPVVREEFEEYLKSLPQDKPFAYGANPDQNPLARYLNEKVDQACFSVEMRSYCSRWHEYKGGELPDWAETFIKFATPKGQLTPAMCLEILEYPTDYAPLKGVKLHH